MSDLQVSGLALDLKALKAGVDDSLRILNRLEDRVESLEDDFERTSRTAGSLGRKLVAVVGAFIGLRQIERVGEYVFDTNVEFQKLEATLKTVEGSVYGAEAAFDLITSFAVSTPFEIQNLTESFNQLRIRGVALTEERFRGLGNVSAAFTEDITRLSDAIVSAANGMSRPIRAFGFDVERSGDQVTISFGNVRRTIRGTAEEISRFVAEIGNTRFADAMTERMMTLDGAISNLKDSTDLLAKKIGEQGLNAEITDLVRTLDQAINDGDEFARILGKNLAGGAELANEALEAFINHIDMIVIGLEAMTGAAIARGIVGLTLKLKALSFTAAGLKTVLSALGGPVGAILTLAGAIGGPLLISMLSAKDAGEELADELERIKSVAMRTAPEDLESAITRTRDLMEATRGMGELPEPFVRMAEAGTIPENIRANITGLAEKYAQLADRLRVLLELQKEYQRISREARLEAASEAYERLLTSMGDELTKLEQGERAMLEQQLVRQGLTEAQRQEILTKWDAIEALKRESEEQERAETAERERRESIDSLIGSLEQQYHQLTKSTDEYIRYQLAVRGATEEEIQHAIEIARSIDQIREAQEEERRAEQERLAELEAEFMQIKSAADRMADALSDSFIEIIHDIDEVGDAFHDLIDTILAETMRLVARKTITEPFSNFLVGILTDMVAGGGGGGVRWRGTTTGFENAAAGAEAFPGQPFIVGEEGPEFFVPKVAGDIVPIGRLGESVVHVHMQLPITIQAFDRRDVIEFFDEYEGVITQKALQGLLASQSALSELRRR